MNLEPIDIASIVRDDDKISMIKIVLCVYWIVRKNLRNWSEFQICKAKFGRDSFKAQWTCTEYINGDSAKVY